MEVAMPVAGTGATLTATAMDNYEDMFKEITRKLYGEDGLPDLASGEKLTGITTSVERGLSNIDYEVEPPMFKPEEHITAFGLAALMQNGFSPLNTNFQQVHHHKSNIVASASASTTASTAAEDKWMSNDEYLQWTQSKIASYNPSQKLFRCADCDCVGFLSRVAEHWLGTHANLRVFQCPQCPYASAWARCVRMHLARQHNVSSDDTNDSFLKDNPVFHEITRYLQRLKNKLEFSTNKSTSTAVSDQFPQNTQLSDSPRLNGNGNGNGNGTTSSTPAEACAAETSSSSSSTAVSACGSASSTSAKRYSCSYCPYATDRRDLFTRHENIHREEKPFQCYVCQKQFNRADHVKKHFLRMHREHPYDLNRIRRHPPKNASGMSYYHKYNNGSSAASSPAESVNSMQSGMQQQQHQLTIPNGFGGISMASKPVSPQPKTPTSVKSNGSGSGKSNSKKKGEKRFSCCYCSWSGVDNWCLKRHLNTHLKPFVCGLCDYKAARSERLATHVLKVHNKRACGRCLFMADDQVQLAAHQQEHHPLEQRNNRSANVLRNNSFNTSNQSNQPFGTGQSLGSNLKPYELSAAAAILQHGSRLLPMAGSIISSSSSDNKSWKPYTPKQHGAARLFNYLEASDGSEPECDTTCTPSTNDNTNVHRNQSDFPEAGDVGNNQGELPDEYEEEIELPLFICRECGCEFVDDTSLETHHYTHHRVEKITSSPANPKLSRKSMKKSAAKTQLDSKENVNPKSTNTHYNCSICKLNFSSQMNIMAHMRSHITLNHSSTEEQNNKKQLFVNSQNQKKAITGAGAGAGAGGQENNNIGIGCYQDSQSTNGTCKRSRKQSQPRKVVPPLCESVYPEIQVAKRSSSKRNSSNSNSNKNVLVKLRDKYMCLLMNRRGYKCNTCKKRKFVFTFRTQTSLAWHRLWRHSHTKPFECEHCSMRFRHRYQTLLHASRAHVAPPADTRIVPHKLLLQHTKEPIHRSVTVPADNENPLTLLTTVPESSTHPHPHPYMLNSNHLPIVIPTFPPS